MDENLDFNKVFNDSFEAINSNPEEFYTLFYEHFTNSSSSIKQAFSNTNMDIQKRMLKTSIAHMVNLFFTRSVNVHLIATAKKHNELDISTDMYELFLNSFLIALSDFYPEFDNNCAIAWRITLSPGIEFMKHYSELE